MRAYRFLPLLLLAVLVFAIPPSWAKSKKSESDTAADPGKEAPAKAESGTTAKGSHPAAAIPKEKRDVSKETKDKVYDKAGIPKQERKNYVIDHKVPLELGGSNAPSNLQPQTKAQGASKDKWENYLAGQVKAGKMTLAEAQAEIQRPHSGPPPGH